jgi:hypothetical protein
MDQKYFLYPFARSGDKTDIPNDTQPTGDVSFDIGYGFDYERELGVDPDAKAIERQKMNSLLFDITEAIKQYQEFGCPEFITTADNAGVPFPYAEGAMVRYRASPGDPFATYESLEDANTALPTDTTKWRLYGYESSLSGNPIWTRRGDGYVSISGTTTVTLNSSGTGTSVVSLPFTLSAVKSARASGVFNTVGQGHEGHVFFVSPTSITLGAKGLNNGTLRVDWTVEGTV